MRFIAIISVLFVLLPITSASGQPAEGGSGRPNSLSGGATGVLFALKTEPAFSFTSGFEGAIKRHHSDGGALRLGIEVTWLRDDATDEEIVSDPVDGDTAYSVRSERSSWSVGGDLLWIGYPVRGGLVNLYWGLGPTAAFSKRKFDSERMTSNQDIPPQRAQETYDAWSLGGKALLGVEWFAVERVSLYMEYRAWLAYESARGEVVSRSGDRTRTSDLDRSGWDVDSDAVLVGLAAYF